MPTRFLVHESLYRQFVDDFAGAADGLEEGVGMGPLPTGEGLTRWKR